MQAPRSARDPGPLFERFRARGDARALGRVFDLCGAELLAVAQHLVRDAAEAEDVLQATFVVAIERAAEYDAARPLVPWLIGILARQAALARRRAGRAPEPDRLAPREPEDPGRAALSAELDAEVERALAALPARYREVVAPVLREGRSPGELARELNRAPGTVRMQLHRGLELLRRALPAGLATGAAAALAPRGLGAVRSEVLRAAAAARPVATSATTGAAALAPSLLGGLAVIPKLALAGLTVAAAALVAVLARSALDPGQEPAVAAVARTELARAPVSTETEPLEPAARRDASPAGEAASAGGAAPALAGSATVLGSVRRADGSPAPGVGVRAVPLRGDGAGVSWAETGREGPGAGSFAIDGLAPGRYRVELDRAEAEGGRPTLALAAGDRAEVELVLAAGVDVSGTVRDDAGRPVGGAEVWITGTDAAVHGRAAARTDASGRFALVAVDPARWVGARAADFRPSELVLVAPLVPGAGGEVDLELVLVPGGGALAGTVRDASGAPAAGALVRIGLPSDAPARAAALAARARPVPLTLRADAEGRFTARGLSVGELPVAARAEGHAVAAARVELGAGRTAHVDLHLERAAVVAGTLRLPDGAPAAGTVVTALKGTSFGDPETSTGLDGTFELEGVRPGEVALRALRRAWTGDGRSGRVEGRVHVGPGARARWDAVLSAGATLAGRALDEDGGPLSGWNVRALLLEPYARLSGLARTDEQGRFSISGAPDAAHRLELVRDHPATGLAWAAVAPVQPGDEAVLLAVDRATRPSALVTGTVLGPDGEPLPAEIVAIAVGRSGYVTATAGDAGRFELEPLPPGEYRLRVSPAGRVHREIGLELGADERRELEVRFEETGTLALRAERRDGGPLAGVELEVHGLDTGGLHALELRDGRARAELEPGRYVLVVGGPPVVPARRSLDVRSGQATELELVLDVGPARRLRLVPSAGGPSPEVAFVTVTDERGDVLTTLVAKRASAEGALEVEQALAPGAYAVEASSDAGLAGRARFTVAAGDGPAVVVVPLEPPR